MEEEMMMVMKMKMNMKIRSQEEPSSDDHNPNHHHHRLKIPIIATTTCPVWKLYENPFYISPNQNQNQEQEQEHRQIHRLHLPIPARKIATSFWDLTFIKPFTEVQAELESERKSRNKADSLNRRLAKEASEERRGRRALQRACQQLAVEISAHKSVITRMRREISDERKMLRTAQVIREERVQMKLSEAKILMEEMAKQNIPPPMAVMKKKSGGGTENPHIRRGIKGFVEFPKVVRAIGCRRSKRLGRLECQKAQLKILLKQKGAVRFNGLLAR